MSSERSAQTLQKGESCIIMEGPVRLRGPLLSGLGQWLIFRAVSPSTNEYVIQVMCQGQENKQVEKNRHGPCPYGVYSPKPETHIDQIAAKMYKYNCGKYQESQQHDARSVCNVRGAARLRWGWTLTLHSRAEVGVSEGHEDGKAHFSQWESCALGWEDAWCARRGGAQVRLDPRKTWSLDVGLGMRKTNHDISL